MNPITRAQMLLYAFAHAASRDSDLAEPEDLEGLAGATHFGMPAGWVYGDGVDWPAGEVRPCLGWFGIGVEAV